jgi:nicotinate-nucleotide--dimethylbenzimidazole phosphoribosyltransferase
MMSDDSNHDNLARLDEIRALIAELPSADLEAGTQLWARRPKSAGAPSRLGRVGDLAEWLAVWQGQRRPRVDRARIAFFCASHGIAADGETAALVAETRRRLELAVEGGGPVSGAAGAADADLQIYELDIEHPTLDARLGPAMNEAECARAMAYGMMVVEPGLHLLTLGCLGDGANRAAAALCLYALGGEATDWASGADAEAAARAVSVNAGIEDPFDAMQRLGGSDLAAMFGAIIAARMARVPVLLDGFAAVAVAALLARIDRRAIGHCQIADRSGSPVLDRLMAVLDKRALLDLGVASEDGLSSALAIGLLRTAAAAVAA